VVVASLVASLRKSTNVCLVGCMLILALSVCGLLLFCGKFWNCNNPEWNKEECTGVCCASPQSPRSYVMLMWVLEVVACVQSVYCEQTVMEGIDLHIAGMFIDDNGELVEAVWARTSAAHFDNIFHSALTVIEVASLEMWPDIAINGVDSTEIGMRYKEGNNPLGLLYFIMVRLSVPAPFAAAHIIPHLFTLPTCSMLAPALHLAVLNAPCCLRR